LTIDVFVEAFSEMRSPSRPYDRLRITARRDRFKGGAARRFD
jgi:hypothetical protein